MFNSEIIPNLVKLFQERNVYLYHACQYDDFCSYIKLGGVPSRKSIEDAKLRLTSFTTDDTDRQNGVWDKVFFNLEDFGKIFASGKGGVPTVYGPILFRFKPTALLDAIDVAICLRSAGAIGFNRDKESLRELSDVDKLFYYPINHFHSTADLKWKTLLQQTFGEKAQAVEVSCTFPNGILPFKDLIDVVVDPYIIKEKELSYYVVSAIKEAGINFSIVKRNLKVDSNLYQCFLTDNPQPSSPKLLAQKFDSVYLDSWAEKIEKSGGLLLKNYYRFLEYLQKGTYFPICSQVLLLEFFEQQEYDIAIAQDFSDDEISSYVEDEIYYYDNESELILDELNDYQNSWARLSDEGWFYSDDEDELFIDELKDSYNDWI